MFVLAAVGTGIELLLLGHTETVWQFIPLVLLALGLGAGLWLAVRPGRIVVRAFRGLTVLFLVAGGLGIGLHYKGNAEFELEMYPSRAGWELFRESMTGATPALAPGTMFLLGFVGLLHTFRHPELTSARPGAAEQTGDKE